MTNFGKDASSMQLKRAMSAFKFLYVQREPGGAGRGGAGPYHGPSNFTATVAQYTNYL